MTNGLKVLFIACVLLILISGCSKNEPEPSEVMFYGESEHWMVQYRTGSHSSQNDTVKLNFFYKGRISELMETKRIVFSYGTSEGSIAETLNYEEIDTAYFKVDFDEDLIQGIVGKPEENMMVIIEWDGKKESMDVTQHEK